MAVYKELSANSIKSTRSSLTQLVDIIQEDISGSTTRRKAAVFVSGGIGPGITSSQFQTVSDQDFTLQTANPVFDMTIGLHPTASIVDDASLGEDSAGKKLFPSSSVMMREKTNLYRQFALALLGDADAQFVAPLNSSNDGDGIDVAMFLAFKRLFARDQIKRETFAMRFHQTASLTEGSSPTNLDTTAENASSIFTDVGASSNKLTRLGGQVSEIVDAANTSRTVGLMFNDHGIAVFDLERITSGTQHVSGVIDAVVESSKGVSDGQHVIGGVNSETPDAKFIPDLMVSASIDDIVDHLASARFSSGSLTAIAFQNVTQINSTIIHATLSPDEFNYSSNPTYTDSDNRIVVIDEGQEDTQSSFVYASGIGLYSSNNELLATAKFSRPIEKDQERSLTIRTRLDFAKYTKLHINFSSH